MSCSLVSLGSGSDISWLEKPPASLDYMSQSYHLPNSPQIKLLSGDGFSIALPLPLLLASSALLRSVLSNHQCCVSVDISVPSVGGGTLVLVGEILRRGETSNLDGDESSKEILKSVQTVLDMLLCGVSIMLKNKSDYQNEIVEEIESTDDFNLENPLWDLNSNKVKAQSPPTSTATVSSPKSPDNSSISAASPSNSTASPSSIASSSITLSPNDIKEEKHPVESKVLYIDVCLEDIVSPSPNLGDMGESGNKPKRIKKEVNQIKIEEENEDFVMSCPFCQRNFRSGKSLKQHIGLLHPEPTHFCSKCDSSFFKKTSLDKHMKLTHLKIQCKSCSLSFSSKLKLSRHAERSHKDYFKCSKCDLKASSRLSLEEHMTAAHANFKCEECPVTLESLDILQKHLEIEHSDARFCCNVCSKIFKTKVSFMKHCEITSHDPKLVTKFKMPCLITPKM